MNNYSTARQPLVPVRESVSVLTNKIKGNTMTKSIRIENADNSDHHVSVEVWEERPDGTDDVLVRVEKLNYPTQMLHETIWVGKYLVIKEEAKIQT